MKAVMISINKPHTDNIRAGLKKWEIRKSKPNISVPFPAFIYETKRKGGCGKVIGEFICDKIKFIKNYGNAFVIDNNTAKTNKIARESCLDYDDMRAYLKDKDGYAWHISDLKIYDQPKELTEFNKPCYGRCGDCIYGGGNCEGVIETAPQSWCYIKV